MSCTVKLSGSPLQLPMPKKINKKILYWQANLDSLIKKMLYLNVRNTYNSLNLVGRSLTYH